MDVQQAISEVGTLYRAITGTELPPPRESQPIPSDRDPEEYVRMRLTSLLEAARGVSTHAPPSSIPGWMPRADVIETNEEWRIEFEVPRVSRKDLYVYLKSGCLVVRGRRTEQDAGQLRWNEVPRGTFLRTMQLPAGVDGSRSSAVLRDGVLSVHLPKGHGYANTEKEIDIKPVSA